MTNAGRNPTYFRYKKLKNGESTGRLRDGNKAYEKLKEMSESFNMFPKHLYRRIKL